MEPRPYAFQKMEALVRQMQDPETGVPVRSQKIFLTSIPAAFMGYDLIGWLMEHLNIEESGEAVHLANQLCQYGYLFPVTDCKSLAVKDDNSLYRFQAAYYWPTHHKNPDNVEYAIYLVKRSQRNKQRHALEDYEQEALNNLKKNLQNKWELISMQAEEQLKVAKERKKMDKLVSDSQERAYWRVHRPPPGSLPLLDPAGPIASLRKTSVPPPHNSEVEVLRRQLSKSRVKASQAVDSLVNYCSTYCEFDTFLTPAQPSNPWLSDDTAYWQFNQPIVETPTDKRVKRWGLSFEDLLSDPTGVEEFTNYLRKEYSHENIRFWLAVKDLKRCAQSQVPSKVKSIYEEFLVHGAPCEINIDSKTLESTLNEMKTPSRFVFDAAAHHVYNVLLNKDCYPRFIRSDHYKNLLATAIHPSTKKRFFGFVSGGKKKSCGGSSSIGSASAMGLVTGAFSTGSSSTSGHQIAVSNKRRGSDRSITGFLSHEPASHSLTSHPNLSSSQVNLHELCASRDSGISPERIAPPLAGNEVKHVSFEEKPSNESNKTPGESADTKSEQVKIPQISKLSYTKSQKSESFDTSLMGLSSKEKSGRKKKEAIALTVSDDWKPGIKSRISESFDANSSISSSSKESFMVGKRDPIILTVSNELKSSSKPQLSSGSTDTSSCLKLKESPLSVKKESPVLSVSEGPKEMVEKKVMENVGLDRQSTESIDESGHEETPSDSCASSHASLATPPIRSSKQLGYDKENLSRSITDTARKFSVCSLKDPLEANASKFEIKSEESLMKIEYHLEKRTVDKSDSKTSITISTEKLSVNPSVSKPPTTMDVTGSRRSNDKLFAVSSEKLSSPAKSIEKLSNPSLSIEKLMPTSLSTDKFPTLTASTDTLPISSGSLEKLPSAPLASIEKLSSSSTEKLPSPCGLPESESEQLMSDLETKVEIPIASPEMDDGLLPDVSLESHIDILSDVKEKSSQVIELSEQLPISSEEIEQSSPLRLKEKSASTEAPSEKMFDNPELPSSTGGSTGEVVQTSKLTLEEAKAVLKSEKRTKKVDRKARVMSEDQHRWPDSDRKITTERRNLSMDDEDYTTSPKKVSNPNLSVTTDRGGNASGGLPAATQPADVCPWEDEESCKTEETFVKKYATLGYL